MKNTVTLALSLNAIKQEVTAQCAWVDATNLASLPPIVNPATNAALDTTISHAISELCRIFSAYIGSYTTDGDIIDMEMYIAPLNAMRQTALSQYFNDFAVFRSLHELYAPQPQASHIVSLYHEKYTVLLSSAKQMLATMQ